MEAIIWIRVHGGGVASCAEGHFRAKEWRVSAASCANGGVTATRLKTRPAIASVSTVQDGSTARPRGGHTVRPGDREAKSQGEGDARVDQRYDDGSFD
ncbi:hypothetical protein GQ600_22228 [Phytophthora cactorum]|nr:hypothetical protein GQ600_22228 [Phytophthora cactorum]